MAQDDVDVVTSFVHNLSSANFAWCETLVTQDLVFSEAPSLPFGGEWAGIDGLRGMLREIGTHYRLRLNDPVIAAAGDRVLVRVSGTIQSRATGRSMELDAVDLYELRGAKICRVDVYYKDAAAVRELASAADVPAAPDVVPA